MFAPLDVEELLAAYFREENEITCFAPPVPADLGDSLPCARVMRTGGLTTSKVVNRHTVSVDVWAASLDEAQATANTLCGSLEDAPRYCDGVNRVAVIALPYNNHDAKHPDLCRVSFTAQVWTAAVRSQ